MLATFCPRQEVKRTTQYLELKGLRRWRAMMEIKLPPYAGFARPAASAPFVAGHCVAAWAPVIACVLGTMSASNNAGHDHDNARDSRPPVALFNPVQGTWIASRHAVVAGYNSNRSMLTTSPSAIIFAYFCLPSAE